MRRVLFLTYHFPPIGGAGVLRPTKLVKYLRGSGYDPIVITGPGPAGGRWTPRDDGLIADIPADVEIHRVKGPEPPRFGPGWRGRAERWLDLTSEWARWWISSAIELGRGVGSEVDLIYVWMQPYESAQAGIVLGRDLRKPWVADLGDPWALDEMWFYATRFHRRRDEERMHTALSSATAVVMSTPEAVVKVCGAFPQLERKAVISIPNGFDPSDFSGPYSRQSDRRFRIVHTGYFHTALGRQYRRLLRLRKVLGGTREEVDIYPRSPAYLLLAVQTVLDEDPSLSSELELHLAGVLSNMDRQLAETSEFIRVHGFIPHDEALDLIRSADLLFLPMQDLPPGTRAGSVPGKTYEYLASGRPILAAVPDGDARDLLLEAGSADVCRPTDVDALAQALRLRIQGWRAKAPPEPPRSDVLGRFAYPVLTRQLAELFDEVLTN